MFIVFWKLMCRLPYSPLARRSFSEGGSCSHPLLSLFTHHASQQPLVAINDVVAVLTDSVNLVDYLKKLRKRDQSLSNAFKGGGDRLSPPAHLFLFFYYSPPLSLSPFLFPLHGNHWLSICLFRYFP